MGIYADYAAAAPLRPEARAAMLDALDAGLGNASSAHDAGARARARLEAAREEIAAALGAHPLEIVFTSGATEANNLALAGVARTRTAPLRIALAATEHASVLAPARALGVDGHAIIELATDGQGIVDRATVSSAEPDLLSIALVNAETGLVQDVAALGASVRARGELVHSDAAQAGSWLALDGDGLGVDLLTLGSTKVGGPAGAGALYVRRGVRLAPLHHGGPHEQGLRAGSENVPAIVGFATALTLAVAERAIAVERVRALRDRVRHGLATAWPDARPTLTTHTAAAPHVLNVMLPGVVGEDVVAALDLEGVAASTGSACAAGAAEPSHVLRAMGHDEVTARSSLRLSFGWNSTDADVDGILAGLARVRTRVASEAA